MIWVHESPPLWDAEKRRIVGSLPEVFPALAALPEGEVLPGDWWRAEQGGQVVGYGWMDATWGDAEILLAVAPAAQQAGVGSSIVERLAEETRQRGFRYLYNVVPARHPAPEKLKAWLVARGFRDEGDGLLKRAI